MKFHKLAFVLCMFVLSFAKIYSKEISSIGFKNPVCYGFDYSNLNLFNIRGKFEQNFQQYAPTIIIYDTENEDDMAKLQAKNNTLGEMETAASIALISLIKAGQSVTMQLKVVDVITNTILGSADYALTMESIEDSNQIEIAIGNICVHVFENLGVFLSSTQIAVLKGEKNSFEFSFLEIDSEIKNMDEQIQALQNEMDELKKKGAFQDALFLNKLKIAQDKLKIKRDVEKRRLERKKEDEKRLQEEKESLAKRSQEANKRIQEQTKKYEQYASKVRKEQMRSISSYQQICEVEKIKQELLSMRIRKDEQIEKFREKELEYVEAECKKIDDRPFELAEKKADGQPIPRAIEERNESKKKIRDETNARIADFIKQTESQQQDYERKVFADISQNYSIMRKTKTINSVNNADTLYLRVGNYDGQKCGWIANVAFDLGLTNIVCYQILIPYESLFDKKPDISEKEYINNVEDYDSFFRNNIPVVYISVEYSVLPLEKDKPSQYLVKIAKTSIYKIETDNNLPPKKISTEKNILEGIYVADVVSDIRTYKEKKLYEEKLRRDEFKKSYIAEKARKKEMRKIEKATEKEMLKTEREAMRAEKSYRRGIEKEKRKEAAKEFFSPAWYVGFNIGLQTYKFDVDTTRAFLTLDMPVYPLFLGMEVATGRSANRQYSKDEHISKAFEYLDSNIGFRLGYRMRGVKQGWFSPYFCINGGISFVDHKSNISDVSQLKENLTGYVAGSLGANFISSLGIFGLSYSCEYNVITKKMQHLLGFSVGINIITEK